MAGVGLLRGASVLLGVVAGVAGAQSAAVEVSRNVVPVSYRIAVTPDLAAARFAGTEEIDVTVKVATDTVVVNAVGIDFGSVRLKEDAGAMAAVSLDEKSATATLHFSRPLTVGAHTLAISYSGLVRTGGSGLFSVKYRSGAAQRQMLVTQFEFSAARRMFPCWDDPAAKATFVLTATLPSEFVAISNTPVAMEEAAGVLKKVTFGVTPKMSPYLLVLVAGELESVRGQVGKVGIGVWTQTGRAESGRAALERTQLLLPLYDDYFGVAYPLPKLDLIAVPHLGFDAMENWGGITFEESEVLYDAKTSSAATLQAARHLVGHEVAHQWFGDLVTTATWNDVWLNESFAEWMSYKATQRLNPEEEPWLNFHAAKKKAMDRDAGPTKSVVGNSFDANTSYRKGPAILRMFETYLGEDTFRRGIREYVKAHAYGNATTGDLWASLKRASGKDVGAIAGTFTDQPGVPLVEVATRCEGSETVATLTQRRFTMDYPDAEKLTWQIPVTIGAVGAKDVRTVVLGGSPAMLRFAGCGRAIKANLGDTGYYRVKYDDVDGKRLVAGYAGLEAADRVNLMSDQWALAQAGYAGIGEYLDLTLRLSNENELVVWTDVLDVLRQIDGLERGADGQAAFRAYARGILHPLMQRMGWEARGGEKGETAALRVKVISALGEFDDAAVIDEAWRRFELLRERSQPLPVELRGVILETVGRHADAGTYEELHALAKVAASDEEKRDFYWAMASAQDATLIDKTVDVTKTNEAKGQYAMMLVTAAQRSDAGRVLHDVEQGRAQVMGGGMSAGLLDAIAEHTFDAAVIGELSADAVYGGKTPGAVRAIEVQAKLRPVVLAGVAEWLRERKFARGSQIP